MAAAFAAHWPTLVARLARRYRDLSLAEECAAEAFAEATKAWRGGMPQEPGAWLWTIAQRRAVDRMRREARFADRTHLLAQPNGPAPREADDPVTDHLALLFGMCHPCLSPDSQVALTLRCLNGLSTRQIATVFLTTTDTMTRRLTRARTRLAANAIPFQIPDPERWPERVDKVLEAIYLTFTAGHASCDGSTFIRGDLCDEARWLASLVERLAPHDPEVLGLVALLDLTDARRPARIGEDDAPVLLADQDRRLWDRDLIASGRQRLTRALRQKRLGRFQIQAALAACHAMAPTWEQTDWRTVVHWYGALLAFDDTPVVRLNRAIAVSCAGRPAEALRELDDLRDALSGYHYYWVARSEAHERVGNLSDAADDLHRALALEPHPSELICLTARSTRLGTPADRAGTGRNGVE